MNPPAHPWATIFTYRLELARTGRGQWRGPPDRLDRHRRADDAPFATSTAEQVFELGKRAAFVEVEPERNFLEAAV